MAYFNSHLLTVYVLFIYINVVNPLSTPSIRYKEEKGTWRIT